MTLFAYFMVERPSFIRSDIHNFISATMWTAADYMRKIAFGQSIITDHTPIPSTTRAKICPCTYRACAQMRDVYVFVTTVASCVSSGLCILTRPLVG
jgi:hypothetical protein